MELHLDPVGGMAGDMFIAAVLDAFPELEEGMLASIGAALLGSSGVSCRRWRHREATLEGSRFVVESAHEGHSGDGRHDGHNAWSEIRQHLERAALPDSVCREAIAIFALLARAEGKVHGVDPERVVFHEIGALDSIADIVGAAHLIAALEATRWSVSPLPLGSGRLSTAHGTLPVPAPATVILLEGFLTLDDGIAGERVTPTGAAIVAHLCERAPPACPRPRTLVRSGVGFGARTLPHIGNFLRVLAFDQSMPALARPQHRELAVIEFEVDDQSAEDLATGLDRLRENAAILDAVQMPVFGKKGRMMTHVRLLAMPAAIEAAIRACFRETTTIGLRYCIMSGMTLSRRVEEIELGGQAVRVKTVDRPDGRTAKAEVEDARGGASHAERYRLRQEAERLALAREVIE